MSGWPKVQLGDHAELVTGFPFKSVCFHDDPMGSVRLLRGDNVGQGLLRWDGAKHWPEDERADYAAFELREGDVILAMDRPWIEAGLKYASVRRSDLPCLLVQRVARLRGINDLTTEYLRYIIGSANFTDHVKGITTGVNVPHISGRDIRKFSFRLPPLPIQRRIASILGAYDDLIEVNRRRIAVLEEMARRLFDEWFVHFRFPGHERTERCGALPIGWRRVPIKTAYVGLFDGPHATPAPADEGPVFLGIGNITETGRLDLSSVRHIAERDFDRWTKRVTPGAGDIVFTYEATLNRYALIPEGFRGCLGRRLALIRAKSATGRNLFLYLYFFTAEWRKMIAANTLSGATVDRIPLSRFPDFPIILPPDDLLVRFARLVRPMFDQMQALDRTNTNAQMQRDLLLPRLISGDLSVAGAERALDTAA